MKNAKKFFSQLIIIAVLLSLTACRQIDDMGQVDAIVNNKTTEVELSKAATSDSGSSAYQAREIELPESYASVADITVWNDNIYICGTNTDGEEAYFSIIVIDADGNTVKDLGYRMPTTEGFIQSIAADGVSGIWALEMAEDRANYDGTASNVNCQLVRIDENGNVVGEYPIESDVNWLPISIATAEDRIYLCGQGMVKVYDFNGELKFDVNVGNRSILVNTSEGIAVSGSMDGSISFLNDTGKTLETSIEFDINCGILGTDGDSMLYLDDKVTAYAYSMATREIGKLFTWTSLGLVRASSMLYPISEDRFVVRDLNGLYVISKTESSTGEKTVLTLATQDSLSLQYCVAEFNREHTDCEVQIKDYSIYNVDGDDTVGQKMLSTEIIAGNVPDIIDLNSFSVELYSNDFLLENLLPYFEADKEINLDTCSPRIIEAMKTNGRLTSFIPMFSVGAVAGKPSDISMLNSVGYAEFADSLDNGATMFGNSMSKSKFMQLILGQDTSEFYDMQTGKCNFDNLTFIEALELASNLPDEVNRYSMVDDIAAGKQRLLYDPVNSVGSQDFFRAYFDDEVEFTGIPYSRDNGAIIIPWYDFGITASSQNKDAAWTFLKAFLDEDNVNYESAFTLKSEYLDKAEDLEREWIAMGGQLVYYSGDTEVEYYITDEKSIDLAHELLNSLTGVYRGNGTIYEIVMSEAAAYFAGDKTAADAAQIIQSRVQIYVSEQR